MKKFLRRLFSVVITLYFSATMFYCFVAGAPTGGNGKVIYLVSAAGLAVLMPGFACITFDISGKNLMNRVNDPDLWYYNKE